MFPTVSVARLLNMSQIIGKEIIQLKSVLKVCHQLVTLLLVATLSTVSAWGADFTFTAIPDQDTTRLQERFGKIADYLSEKLGITVKYIPVKSYSASVQAFKNNEVQLAWFGGLSGVQARIAVPNSVAIAQGAEDPDFISYFIANTSTGLSFSEEFPKAIADKTFTFGSKGSTSGRLMPEYFIREAFGGKAPREVFKRVGFSGDHSKTLALVQAGSYEVGAMNFKVWLKEVEAGKVDPKKVQVIWRTPRTQTTTGQFAAVWKKLMVKDSSRRFSKPFSASRTQPYLTLFLGIGSSLLIMLCTNLSLTPLLRLGL